MVDMNDNQQSTLGTLLGKANKAQADLDAQKALYETWKNEGASMRNKLFENMAPQIDTEKEQKLRDYGKAQAITDFLTSLTTGVIGTASKGYAPQVGANAQPYVTDLSSLRDINRKKQEAYDQMKAEVEYGAYEKEGQRLAREVEKAERKVEQADNDVFAWQKFEEQQNRIDARTKANNDARTLVATIRAAKKSGDKSKVMDFGGTKITVPAGTDALWYSYLVNNGVPKRYVDVKVRDMMGNETFVKQERTPKSRGEFQAWLGENLNAALPHIELIEGISVEDNLSTTTPPSYTPQQAGNNTGFSNKTISGW